MCDMCVAAFMQQLVSRFGISGDTVESPIPIESLLGLVVSLGRWHDSGLERRRLSSVIRVVFCCSVRWILYGTRDFFDMQSS